MKRIPYLPLVFALLSSLAFAVDGAPPADPAACVPILVAQQVPVEHPLDAQIEQTVALFEPEFEPEFRVQFGSTAQLLWQRFKIFRNANSAGVPFDEIFIPAQVQFIFSDPRHYVYFKNLSKLLDHFAVPTPTEADPNPVYVRNADQDFREILTTALRTILHNQVPAASIPIRIEALLQNPQENALKRVLGDISVAEARELLFGSDLNVGPSPESLMGQWLQANAGVQPIRRKFPEVQPPQNRAGQQQQVPAPAPVINPATPERWVIPLDANGFPSFEQHFYGPNWVSIIGHARLINGGKVFDYSSQAFSNYRIQNPGSILPVTLLSTTEAQRLWGFAILMNKYGKIGGGWFGQGQLAHHPWEIPGFLTARSIYACCTKWIGDMPIGDALVDEYSFPGHRDQTVEVRARLQPYVHADPLLKRIWSVPGHMQFSEMLGLKDAQIRGEFANTGWIYQVLLAQASLERVPFVFTWTADQRAVLDPQFPYQHEGAH